ncbi:MAG: hypothetical protein FWE85_01380 [Clostridiales bacterium]|nr:hypothetical protein [Clostridiales bacterium]
MDDLSKLLKKIDFGYDCIIRSMKIKDFNCAEVIISAQDQELNKWVNIKFIINSLEECKIIKNLKRTNVVLSSGIQIVEVSGIYYLDLDPYSEEYEPIEDLKYSEVYFAGKSFCWEIGPYSEVEESP